MKRYIVQRKSVPTLAEAIVLQDAKVFLEKDDKSSLYIAHIGEGIYLPDSIKALEISDVHEETSSEIKAKPGKRFLDLRLCVEIPGEINKNKLEKVLYREISKTLKNLLDDDDKPEENKP